MSSESKKKGTVRSAESIKRNRLAIAALFVVVVIAAGISIGFATRRFIKKNVDSSNQPPQLPDTTLRGRPDEPSLAPTALLSISPSLSTELEDVNPSSSSSSSSSPLSDTQWKTSIYPTFVSEPTGFSSISPTSSSFVATEYPSQVSQLPSTELLTQIPATSSSIAPSKQESLRPSTAVSENPSKTIPIENPSEMPSRSSLQPTPMTSTSPTALLTLLPSDPALREVLYRPGELTISENGLVLSQGLRSRLIARTGYPVQYSSGEQSTENFHLRPDGGACFEDSRPSNPGGWIYVSNSEVEAVGEGRVGGITFDRDGNITSYEVLLLNTTMNCGGGRTPWNTWVSCEEHFENGEGAGQIYQVDPTGERPSEMTNVGFGGGRFESFTYDVRDRSRPHFFASEDRPRGALRRFTPHNPDWNDPWSMLHGEGSLDYLMMRPTTSGGGIFWWGNDLFQSKLNAKQYYPESEGIDVDGNRLYMVCKRIKSMFILDLDAMTYKNYSTTNGVFDGSPDQVARVLEDNTEHDILYFTEEGGRHAGIHGRNSIGQFFTILEGPSYRQETTGIAFSPDGHRLYVAFQDDGFLFEVSRVDGLPFFGRTLDIKFHNTAMDSEPSED